MTKYEELPESTKESHRKANMRYSQKMEKQVKINLHKENDADIIAALEACGNVQGYIKSLIRRDIDPNKPDELIDPWHLRRWINARWSEFAPNSEYPLKAMEILDQIDREIRWK